MLFRERKILPNQWRTSIHCDVETREWVRLYAEKWGVTQVEALYRMISMAIDMEEGLVSQGTVPQSEA